MLSFRGTGYSHLSRAGPGVQRVKDSLLGLEDGLPGSVPLARAREAVLERSEGSEIAEPTESWIRQKKLY